MFVLFVAEREASDPSGQDLEGLGRVPRRRQQRLQRPEEERGAAGEGRKAPNGSPETREQFQNLSFL